jgi:DNA replication and repair protein RecF
MSTLDVWDVHLARHGAQLLAGRLDLCAALAPLVAKAYDAVSAGRGDAIISYAGSWSDDDAAAPSGAQDLEETLRAKLLEARSSEVERGVTLVGPHRDDVTLMLGEVPAKGYASHGESWSYALALRLAAYDLLRSEGIEPVLALDDVFAELDTGRRERLAELVAGASQTLVTCAVEADVPAGLRGSRYEVAGGEVRRVG